MQNIIKKIFNKTKNINQKNIFIFLIILFFSLPLISKGMHLENNPLFQILGNNQENILPKFSLKSFNNKSFQKQFENNLGYSLPWTNLYIKNFNTIMFYIFNKSYSEDGSLIIGKNKYIFGTHYFTFYMNDLRYKPIQAQEMMNTIDDFKLLQNYLKRKNKTLIIMVTPNKAAFYSEYLPDRYVKFNKYKRADKDYYVFMKILKDSGLNYVNTRDYLNQLKDKNDIFEKDNVTWSLPTAFIFTQKLIDKINSITGNNIERLKLEKIIEHETPNPKSLPSQLLNIFYFPKEYSYQEVIPLKHKNTSNLKLGILGGCFTYEVVDLLNSANTFDTIESYNADSIQTINDIKYNVYHIHTYPKYKLNEEHKITDINHLMKNLLKNDVIVVDFNESFLLHLYLKTFIPEIKKYMKENP